MRWVALLRGMNLGGRRLTNDRLVEAFAQVGMPGATPFRASGNVVFTSEETDEATLAQVLSDGLERALGYPVPTLLRTGAALREVAARTPFTEDEQSRSKGKHQVLFFASPVDPAVSERATERDRLVVVGREVHWLPHAGTLESEVDWDALNRVAGLGTTRTLGTVQGILKKL